MNPRMLAILSLIAILGAACSSAATTPTATAVAPPTESAAPTATAIPSVALGGEVTVAMSDAMRYSPDPITVKAGEEVTFVVTNDGVIAHEFFVGSEEEQIDHAAEMAAGGMSHGDDNALSLMAGESGSLTMTFAEAGSLLIGCHQPGHYEAGMKATLTVVD